MTRTEKKRLRRKGIRAQNRAAGRGEVIPKLVVVLNQIKAAADRADAVR